MTTTSRHFLITCFKGDDGGFGGGGEATVRVEGV